MDSTGIAATYVAFTQAQTGQALQTEMLKMAADSQASVVALLQSGMDSLAAPAAPSAGLGAHVDISA